jgi:hypothetical protein
MPEITKGLATLVEPLPPAEFDHEIRVTPTLSVAKPSIVRLSSYVKVAAMEGE